MQEDAFPLINGGIVNALKIIDRNCIDLKSEDLILKMREIKELMEDSSLGLTKYYLVDQFLNLIDKIKYADINKTENKESKELYQLAYLFSFWLKQHQTNTSNEFDDLIKRQVILFFTVLREQVKHTQQKKIYTELSIYILMKILMKRLASIRFNFTLHILTKTLWKDLNPFLTVGVLS